MSNERSARRRSLVAFAVLLPAVVWMSAHEDFASARQNHATDAIEALPTQTVSFAGLSWRLLDLKATAQEKIPETTQVEVRLQIDITSPQAVQSLRACQSYLEDSTGQRWSAQPSRYREISCAQLPGKIGANGKHAVIIEHFLIPTHRAADVNLAVVIPKQRPRYLRFQRS